MKDYIWISKLTKKSFTNNFLQQILINRYSLNAISSIEVRRDCIPRAPMHRLTKTMSLSTSLVICLIHLGELTYGELNQKAYPSVLSSQISLGRRGTPELCGTNMATYQLIFITVLSL